MRLRLRNAQSYSRLRIARARELGQSSYIFFEYWHISDITGAMYLLSDFEINIDIANCVEFYADFDNNLLARLRAQFDGICYGGCLILRVVEVLRAGECVFSGPTTPTVGTLAVAFRALVASYAPGDVVAVTVARAEGSRVAALARYVRALFAMDEAMSSGPESLLRENSAVLAVINGQAASVGHSRVSAVVELRMPARATSWYPIIAGTANDAARAPEMTREIYAASDIIPPDQGSGSSAATIQQVARALQARASARPAESANAAEIVRRVICPRALASGSEPKIVTTGTRAITIEYADLLGDATIPRDATCAIILRDMHPLDARVGFASVPIDQLPAEWKQDGLAQPGGAVIARLLEKYVTLASASEDLISELSDSAKAKASHAVFKSIMMSARE